jgi:hypothetical protein
MPRHVSVWNAILAEKLYLNAKRSPVITGFDEWFLCCYHWHKQAVGRIVDLDGNICAPLWPAPQSRLSLARNRLARAPLRQHRE